MTFLVFAANFSSSRLFSMAFFILSGMPGDVSSEPDCARESVAKLRRTKIPVTQKRRFLFMLFLL